VLASASTNVALLVAVVVGGGGGGCVCFAALQKMEIEPLSAAIFAF